MVISNVGYIGGLYEIVITQVPNVTEAEINTFLNQANSDRTSYMPGVPDKPKKIVVNLDIESVTENQIIDMLDRGLYYPEKPKAGKNSSKTSKEQNKGNPSS